MQGVAGRCDAWWGEARFSGIVGGTGSQGGVRLGVATLGMVWLGTARRGPTGPLRRDEFAECGVVGGVGLGDAGSGEARSLGIAGGGECGWP